MKGTLYLLPNLLSDELSPELFLPKSVNEAILKLDGLIVENEKVARRYLSKFQIKKPLPSMPLMRLDEHTQSGEIRFLLEPLERGEQWGLLSDAGLPCIADPGYELVNAARKKNIKIEALVGPCSLILALMLSGLPAQNFSFHGYLPREKEERRGRITLLEQESKRERRTQLCIEAPYRNQELLLDLILVLNSSTELAVAWDLTMPSEQVVVASIAEWRKREVIDIKKKPAIFLFSSLKP